MLRYNREKQQAYEFVSIEELVPQDHLLRKVDKYIDFSFIDEKVRPLYCADNGRPAIDPVVLFKMIFLGYFTASVRSVNWNARFRRIWHTVGFLVWD